MMIEYPVWLVAINGLLLIAGPLAVWLWLRNKKQASPPLPNEWALTARAVFTTSERRVYRLLTETLPNHVILSKLPLVRFCQPIELGQLRYWYDILGANYVSFAICAPNGRVLAAIDINKDRASETNLGRSVKIKRAVLRSCRVRYLRTPAGKLPTTAEIYALLDSVNSNLEPPPTKPLDVPGSVAAAAAKSAAAEVAAHMAQQAASREATNANTTKASPAGGQTQGSDPLRTPILNDAVYPPQKTPDAAELEASETTDEAARAQAQTSDAQAHDEALSRAREALASTVATRRAQRNIMWQESNVFQDSFFALDRRLDEFADSNESSESTATDPAKTPVSSMVVKVTLEDMVPSERLGRVLHDDIEEARYAPSSNL